MTGILLVVVCEVYQTFLSWENTRSFRILTKMMCDKNAIRPEIAGAWELFLSRIREIWEWGAPNE
jgi:DNA-binding transcriptional regulator of glucitol operon